MGSGWFSVYLCKQEGHWNRLPEWYPRLPSPGNADQDLSSVRFMSFMSWQLPSKLSLWSSQKFNSHHPDSSSQLHGHPSFSFMLFLTTSSLLLLFPVLLVAQRAPQEPLLHFLEHRDSCGREYILYSKLLRARTFLYKELWKAPYDIEIISNHKESLLLQECLKHSCSMCVFPHLLSFQRSSRKGRIIKLQNPQIGVHTLALTLAWWRSTPYMESFFAFSRNSRSAWAGVMDLQKKKGLGILKTVAFKRRQIRLHEIH